MWLNVHCRIKLLSESHLFELEFELCNYGLVWDPRTKYNCIKEEEWWYPFIALHLISGQTVVKSGGGGNPLKYFTFIGNFTF